MRTACAIILTACLATCLAAGEAPPSAGSQRLIDDAVAATSKARQVFETAAKKEQDKLVAALTKEQEKETKRGNLDGALAIKALIEQVQGGLLQQKAGEASDLLGDAGRPPPPGTAAGVATDCAVAAGTARNEGAPNALEAVLARCSGIALPKGDRTHYTFTATSAGSIIVSTGTNDRNHSDIWPELLKAGFTRVDNAPWFVLDARPGMKFTVWDPPLAAAQLQVFAAKFKTVR